MAGTADDLGTLTAGPAGTGGVVEARKEETLREALKLVSLGNKANSIMTALEGHPDGKKAKEEIIEKKRQYDRIADEWLSEERLSLYVRLQSFKIAAKSHLALYGDLSARGKPFQRFKFYEFIKKEVGSEQGGLETIWNAITDSIGSTFDDPAWIFSDEAVSDGAGEWNLNPDAMITYEALESLKAMDELKTLAGTRAGVDLDSLLEGINAVPDSGVGANGAVIGELAGGSLAGRRWLQVLNTAIAKGTYISNYIDLIKTKRNEAKVHKDSIETVIKASPAAALATKGPATAVGDIELKDSEDEIPSEVLEKERRFQDQCFLTSNFKKIKGDMAPRTARNPDLADDDAYEHFVSVQGEPFIATNNLVYKRSQKAFVDLDSTEMSLLLPKIALQKVFVSSGDNPKETTTVDFRFGTHNDFRDPSALTMGRRARGDDAGIESFSFSFEGQDYATADKILVCNATYFFKTVSDFIAEFKKGRYKYSYSDLAAYPAGRAPFVIKAVVGWEPPINIQSIVGPLKAKEIAKAAKSAKLSIFMNVVNFNYEVNEDGSLKVFVEYRGWLNNALSNLNFDIFLSPASGENIDELKVDVTKYLRDQMKEKDKRSKKIKLIFGEEEIRKGIGADTSTGTLSSMAKTMFMSALVSAGAGGSVNTTTLDKAAEDSLESYVAKRGPRYNTNAQTAAAQKENDDFITEVARQLHRQVNSLLEQGQLVNHDGLLEEIFKEDFVHKVTIPKSSIVHYQTKSVNKRLTPSLRKTDKIMDKDISGFTVQSLKTSEQQKIGDNLISATNKTFRNRSRNIDSKRGTFPEAGGFEGRFGEGGSYNIHFVTFGAILNAVLKRVYSPRSIIKNPLLKKFKVIVGPAFTDSPSSPFNDDTMSIADLPVSLDLFTYWYLTEIMESGKVTYGVGNFIQSMLNSLVLPAMGAACLDDEAGDLYTIKGQVYNSSSRDTLKKGKRYAAMNIKLKESINTKVQNLTSYYYLYIDSKTTSKAVDKFKAELKSGKIIQLGTGYNRGLTRTIKFKGNDIPYFQEAADAMLNENDSESSARRMLKFHNAEIELFGNTIFYPGMIVYIAPNFPGIRTPFGNPVGSTTSPKKIASALGIGGYYVVTKVKSSIDPAGGFKTTLTANYEAGVS